MIPVIPWYITAIVVATNLAIAVGVWRLLASATPHGGVRIGTALFLGTWLGAVFLLAPGPEWLHGQDPFTINPLIPLFASLPAAIVLLALRLSPALRGALAAVSLPGVHGIQVYRVVGAAFVILLAQGQLPAHFALPAGWGDVAIGVAAPIVAFALARGLSGAGGLALAWNVLGLLDLGVAVGMGTGFLAPYLAPSLGARVPPAPAMGLFPLVLIPTFAVPVSVLLHLTGIGRLAGERRVRSSLVAGHAR